MDFALIVSVNGPAHFVAECGEQLAWLGASLQPAQQGHFSCTTPGLVSISAQPLTYIANSMAKQFHTSPEDARQLETAHDDHKGEYPTHNWAITFESGEREPLRPGGFFQSMMPCFTTRGYPTLRRPSSCAGLEVSENMISTLLKSVQLNHVKECLSIFTLNHEFQLAKIEDIILVWHPTESPDQICACGFHKAPWRNTKALMGENEVNLSDYRHVFEYCPGFKTLTKSRDLVRGVSCPDTPEGAWLEVTEDTAGSSSSTHTSSRYASIDSDMHSISNVSYELLSKPRDPGDPLTQLLEAAAHRLLVEFRNIGGSESKPFASTSSPWTDCFVAAVDGDESSNSEGRSGTQTNGPLKSQRADSTSRGTIQPSRKRRRHNDEEEESNNGQPPQKKPTNTNKKDLPYGSKLLACPYWKLDHVKHRKCFPHAQVTVDYIKQHIRKHHYDGFYCGICFATFKSKEGRVFHNEKVKCRPDASKRLKGITHEQNYELSRKLNKTLSKEERWYAVWDIVFPGQPQPATAYVEKGASDDLCRYRDFTRSRGTIILREMFRSSGLLPLGSDVDSLVQEAVARAWDRVDDEWLASHSSSNSRVERGGSDVQLARTEVSISSFADSGFPTQSHPTPSNAMPLSQQPFGVVPAPGAIQLDGSSLWQELNGEELNVDLTSYSMLDDASANLFNFDNQVPNWLPETQGGWSNVQQG